MTKHKAKKALKWMKSWEGTIIGKGMGILAQQRKRRYEKHRAKSTKGRK